MNYFCQKNKALKYIIDNPIFIESLVEALEITAIIFFLMILVEIFVLKFRNKINLTQNKNKLINYSICSFAGSLPGCMGTFVMDTFYISGLLSFGGLISVMIATLGDESFLILSMFISGKISPTHFFLLVGSLFIAGILGGYLADFYAKKSKLKLHKKCAIEHHEELEKSAVHFIKHHIFGHIFKKHIIRLFIWIFIAVLFIEIIQLYYSDFQLDGIHIFFVFAIACIVGIIPISGPNVFLLVMFSQGIIPFSVLLANSIIQDGHGLLPILGFSVKDALWIKLFNFFFGALIGGILLLFGF